MPSCPTPVENSLSFILHPYPMNLFEQARQQQIYQESPLANRLRPRTLDEYVGQEHIIGPGRLLRRAIQADQLSSLIFYGPPGTGKTTLARVIANSTKSHFITINAVLAGVADIRTAITAAQERRNLHNQRTTLFVDEVHRWNKAQQDALLPHVENGTIILIGATTENPYFEVNRALVSRSRIFQLKPLTETHLRQIINQALSDPERGYGNRPVDLQPDAMNHLVQIANGDARTVLNALELAVETTPAGENGRLTITLEVAEESIQQKAVLYDKDGDVHYDTISAFIKSLRGSDPDAALYWLAKMVYAGEDPRFIFRRMAILAGEDIGLANPQAMNVVNSCWELYEKIGLPEGRYHLSIATLYLATSPKSNSVMAFFDALAAVEKERESDVPNHLKDGNRDAEGFGHGQGYLYPHAYRDHWVAQQYLPAALQGRLFYQPSDQGEEQKIQQEVARKREVQLAAMLEQEEPAGEIFSTSPADHRQEAWLKRAMSHTGRLLAEIRDKVFELAQVQRHYLVLDLYGGAGLFCWEAVRQTPEGGVWVLPAPGPLGDTLRQQAQALPELNRPVVLSGQPADLPHLLPKSGPFEVILARNFLSTPANRTPETAGLLRQLAPAGRLVLAQTLPRQGQRLYQLVHWSDEGLQAKVQAAEEAIYHNPADPLVNWDAAEVAVWCAAGGWQVQKTQILRQVEERRMTAEMLTRWFASGGEKPSYGEHLQVGGCTAGEVDQVRQLYTQQLLNQVVEWHTAVGFWAAG